MMTEVSGTIKCSNCGENMPSEWISSSNVKICPNCGSTNQDIQIEISEKMSIYECLEGILDDAGLPSNRQRKKTRTEFRTGHDWSNRLQKMVHKERLIDRRNDIYRELVTDPATGEVIHECEEPLSQHTGHGDAKRTERSPSRQNRVSEAKKRTDSC